MLATDICWKLMHTLGSSLFSVYLGFLTYLLLKVKADNLSLTILLIASALCLFILVWLLEMEDKAKRDGTNSHNQQMKNILL